MSNLAWYVTMKIMMQFFYQYFEISSLSLFFFIFLLKIFISGYYWIQQNRKVCELGVQRNGFKYLPFHLMVVLPCASHLYLFNIFSYFVNCDDATAIPNSGLLRGVNEILILFLSVILMFQC